MSQEPVTVTIPTCGCTWHGDAHVRECEKSRQIRARMEHLHDTGQGVTEEWSRLKDELEREHTPKPVPPGAP